MIHGLLFVLGVATSSALLPVDCSHPIDLTRSVDTTLVRMVDVDGDSLLDEVRLHLVARRFDQAFSRELTIVSKDRVLLRRSDNDHSFDALFADTAYTSPCVGYARCKCEWYFHSILDSTVRNTASLGGGVFDRTQPNSIYAVGQTHLVQHCGASVTAAREAIIRAVARMRSGGAVFVVDAISPVKSGNPFIWFSEFSCFAPVYIE